MITALFPAFLAAGVVVAVIPVGLHLIARRPPERRPLPTARFLREDARTFLRLRRRPTDVPLLLLRVLFALTLGFAFAGLTWTRARSGDGRVVLIDGGADSMVDWDATVQSTADHARSAGTDVVIVAYGLDGGPRVVALEDVASLERGSTHATYVEGLRALRSLVLTNTRFASVEVTWLAPSSWRSWTIDVGLLRPAIWPGRIDVDWVPGVDTEPGVIPLESVGIRVASPSAEEAGAPLARAAVALGYTIAATPLRADRLIVASVSAVEVQELSRAAREGATVVVFGPLEAPSLDIPWDPNTPVTSALEQGGRGGVVVAPGIRVGTDVSAEPGRPRPGSRLVAVFADATPAASAMSLGDGCMVYSAVSLGDERLIQVANYPALVDALLRGCEDAPDGPLDAGALQTLVGVDLPPQVDLASLSVPEGTPLTAWLGLLAALLLALDVIVSRRSRA
jgi:hypothetical protein